MAGQENLDHDLRDFSAKKKAKTTRESGAWFKALLVMRKWRCRQKALCQRTLNRTTLGRCRCFWLFRICHRSEEARLATHPSGLSALQRKMVEQHPNARKFLNHKETIFSDIHRTCHSLSRAPLLKDLGVGTPVFTAEGEKLWCYFIFVGKRFCISQ